MTNPEVIAQLRRLLSDNVVVGKERIALEIAIDAVEKREPVEPIHIVKSSVNVDGAGRYYGDCPVCGNHLDSLWTDKRFCSQCGQTLVWPKDGKKTRDDI